MTQKILPLRGLIHGKYTSEAACAREMGWTRQKLNKLTTGKKIPDIAELKTLSVTLGVSIDLLANIFLSDKSPNG